MNNVMLAKQGSLADLNKKDFIFEPKFDGTRVLIFKKGRKIKIVNRRNNNITYRYPELEDLWKNIMNDSVIDGELVVLGKNNLPDFNLLQKREQLDNRFRIHLLSREYPSTVFAFDILKIKNKNLENLPLLKRKDFLRKNIKNSGKISFTPYVKDGRKLWKKILKLGMEGVMAKKSGSRYEKGRSSFWVKIKNTKTIDAVIIGYTREKREISALVLGAYHKKKLIYIGRVAAGLGEKTIRELSKKLTPAKIPSAKAETGRKIFYTKPNVIVEVKYLEITRNFQLRAPSLLRIRTDKSLKECVI